jgi:uncharacterized membrane protein
VTLRSEDLQVGISWILRIGVILSAILAASGVLLSSIQSGSTNLCLSSPPNFSSSCDAHWRILGTDFFSFVRATIAAIPSGASAFELISLGIVTLMLTPYFRIVAAMVFYSVERDWKYVAITSFVFVIVTVGLLIL